MKIFIRNVLTVLGIYCLSIWLYLPIAMIYEKITSGIMYGGFFGALLLHVLSSVPLAVLAFGGGILFAYIFGNTKSNKRWLFVLAILYLVRGLAGWSFAQQHPEFSERLFILLQALIPAITCYLGGTVVSRVLKIERIDGSGTLNNAIEPDRE